MNLREARNIKYIGVGTLALASVTCWGMIACGIWWPAWTVYAKFATLGLLVATAVLDIFLLADNRPTVTAGVRAILPAYLDYAFLAVEGVGLYFAFGLEVLIIAAIYVIRGHCHWNE